MNKKLLFTIFVFFVFISPSFVLAKENSSVKKKAILFYSDSCHFCEDVENYFQKEGIYDRYEIKRVNVGGSYNFDYLNDFFDSFGVNEEKRGWPVVFFGQNLLVGSEPIINNFVLEMEKSGTENFPRPLSSREKEALSKIKEIKKENIWHSIFSLAFFGSFSEAFSPGTLSVLIFFFLVFWPLAAKKKYFFSVIFFILSFFLVRMVFEVLLFLGISPYQLSSLSVFSGLFAVSLGIFSFLFPLDDGYFLLIERYRVRFFSEKINEYFKSFLLGVPAGFFLVPSFRGPFVSFFGELFADVSQEKKIAVLFIYGFAVIIPLTLIICFFYFWKKKSSGKSFSRAKLRNWRMSLGAALFLAGVLSIKSSLI